MGLRYFTKERREKDRRRDDRNRKCGSTSFNYKPNEIYIKAYSVQRQDEELD